MVVFALSIGSAGCASDEDVLVSTNGRTNLPDAGSAVNWSVK